MSILQVPVATAGACLPDRQARVSEAARVPADSSGIANPNNQAGSKTSGHVHIPGAGRNPLARVLAKRHACRENLLGLISKFRPKSNLVGCVSTTIEASHHTCSNYVKK